MGGLMKEAVVVSAVRTAVGKAPRGILKDTRPDDIAAMVIKEAFARAPGLKMEDVDDIVLGCAFPESDQGLNLGRVVAMRAGFPHTVPGQTVNRFCSSGLQAIATAAYEIMVGGTEVMIAGGVEFMSQVPIMGLTPSPNPYLVEHNPQAYTSMGLTAENVAEKFKISREDQDRFALSSHQKAAKAIKEGKFKEEVLPIPAKVRETKEDGTVVVKEVMFDTDEGVRYDASLEGLATLKPVFKAKGTVTAGNSSQTSDGAAAVVLMSKEKAAALKLKPMAVFRSFAVAGVPPEIMGVGPAYAVPKALKKARSLEGKHILVVGSGEMGMLVAQALAAKDLTAMYVANRTYGRAVILADKIGGKAVRLSESLPLHHTLGCRDLLHLSPAPGHP